MNSENANDLIGHRKIMYNSKKRRKKEVNNV